MNLGVIKHERSFLETYTSLLRLGSLSSDEAGGHHSPRKEECKQMLHDHIHCRGPEYVPLPV